MGIDRIDSLRGVDGSSIIEPISILILTTKSKLESKGKLNRWINKEGWCVKNVKLWQGGEGLYSQKLMCLEMCNLLTIRSQHL